MPTPKYSDFVRYSQEATAAGRAAGLADSGLHNGEADAFRHAYASAEMTREFGEGWARVLGSVNELKHPLDIFDDEANMDLWNNARGREIGLNSTSKQDSIQQILVALQNGTLIPNLADPRNRYYDDYATLPQAGLPSIWGIEGLDSVAIANATSTATTAALNWVAPRRDPLVLDLDGNGITTSGINPASPILFDQDGDGTLTATGWIASGEAIVVRDLNGNGLIDSGRELFGDNTILTHGPNTGQTAANGFAALADLDANASGVADGKFDASDVAFSSVKLWKDLNQDGISQSGELFTFAQLGIQSISVSGTAGNIDLGGGNTQTFSGSFTRVGGQTGASGTAELAGSLLLANNNFYRQFTDDPALTAAAQALPQMTGSGLVRDLRPAVSLGTPQAAELLTQLTQFAADATRDLQQIHLDALIQSWGATSPAQKKCRSTSPQRTQRRCGRSMRGAYGISPWRDRCISARVVRPTRRAKAFEGAYSYMRSNHESKY